MADPVNDERTLTPLQETVLAALREAGGRATVYTLIDQGYLPASTGPDGRAYGDGKRIGYGGGLAFAALERRGIVSSAYNMDEPAAASKVWRVSVDAEGENRGR